MEAYVMDAFSARLFGGNQAGVVLPDRPLTDAEMPPKVSLFIDLEETHDDHADRASEHQPEQK